VSAQERDGGARARVARAQALVAAFLTDPEAERAIRADPTGSATRYDVSLELAERLARTPAGRVQAFRASMAHKDAVRGGKPPSAL
jgi:hypothetical protein